MLQFTRTLIDRVLCFLPYLLDEGLLLRFGLRLNCLPELRGLLTHHTHFGPHCADLSPTLV